MKRIAFIMVLFSLVFVSNSQNSSIIKNVLEQRVEQKVSLAQELIKFDDVKADKLKSIEIDYLFSVQKVEKCFLCNKKKRLSKLREKRDSQLQEILEREQYIKYLSFENKSIMNIPVQL